MHVIHTKKHYYFIVKDSNGYVFKRMHTWGTKLGNDKRLFYIIGSILHFHKENCKKNHTCCRSDRATFAFSLLFPSFQLQ